MKRITDENFQIEEETVVAIGNFDGLHPGHLRLLEAARAAANGRALAVFTFTPHPSAVFGKPVPLINTADERAQILGGLGVDYLLEYPCGKAVLAMPPLAFTREILIGRARCAGVAVGEGFRFGQHRAGGVDDFRAEGLSVSVVPPVTDASGVVSSTAIRKLIAKGDMPAAAARMGRPYAVFGQVAMGRQLGRTLGFPTANLLPEADKLLPPDGVYAAETDWAGRAYPGVTNVGTNPTVGGARRTVETYLFDVDQPFYGDMINVRFRKFLRGEQSFGGLEALKAAIAADAAAAKAYLGG